MIYIDAQMPTNCYDCWIRQNMGCRIANDSGWLNDRRADNCPIQAQEPRILRLDELHGNDTAYIELNNLREPVLHCIIYYDKEADGMDVKPIKTNISSAYLRYSEHNRVWRPWTGQPSDAQREATPWND